MNALGNKGSLQLTLAIFKPHVIKATHALEGIHKLIKDNKFIIVKELTVKLNQEQAKRFYAEHEKKFYFNRLVTSMTSGECKVNILAKNNAIQDWRQLMGPTRVYQTVFTHPESIRGRYGLTDTRNASHGSDSIISADREISFFFPEFNMEQWLKENDEEFPRNLVKSDKNVFVNS